MWQANVFTVFPEIYPGNLGVSAINRERGKLWDLNIIDIKLFANKYGRIDDTPYGGGNGMILSPTVFEKAFRSLSEPQKLYKRVYLSPRGHHIEQKDLQNLSQSSGVTLLCGRYEGVDQRILDQYEFEEWSLGDFVLMGGDVGALLIIEGCVRLIPGIVQKQESINNDSFMNGLLEYDQYTKPYAFNGKNVPDILLSGNHSAIQKYRFEQSMKITKTRRPDLWHKFIKNQLAEA